MANRHFGKIGDVWKHLPLMELLSLERPARYWESHAGSATYPLTHSPERDHGVYWFLDHAASKPSLETSRYRAALVSLPREYGYPSIYPGSAMLAMLELGSGTSDYLLCDVDPESVSTLKAGARRTGILGRARCLEADGIATLWEEATKATIEDPSDVLVFIDPFDPLDVSGPSKLSAVELCLRLAKLGFKVVYWYGYEVPKLRAWAWHDLAPRLAGSAKSVWCGDMSLAAEDPAITSDPLRGCGLVCANFPEEAYGACTRLAEDLEEIYQGAMFPTGDSGALEFVQLG